MLLIILSCNQKTYFMRLRLFIRFLEVYGLYEEYFSELRHSQSPYYSDRLLRNRLSRLEPNRYIISPINWRITFRGSHFWSMVNKAWLDYLNYHTSKN